MLIGVRQRGRAIRSEVVDQTTDRGDPVEVEFSYAMGNEIMVPEAAALLLQLGSLATTRRPWTVTSTCHRLPRWRIVPWL